jgi:hypothetical protein
MPLGRPGCVSRRSPGRCPETMAIAQPNQWIQRIGGRQHDATRRPERADKFVESLGQGGCRRESIERGAGTDHIERSVRERQLSDQAHFISRVERMGCGPTWDG